jgi:hypothetical protein
LGGEHSRVQHLADEQRVAAKVLGRDYPAAEHGVGLREQVGDAVVVQGVVYPGELVHLPAGLHAEAPYGLKADGAVHTDTVNSPLSAISSGV